MIERDVGRNMTRPLTREFTSTGESFLLILVYRIGSALYSIGYTILFDGLGTILRLIIGIAGDFWHSDHRYTRHFVGLFLSLCGSALGATIGVLRWCFEIIEGLIF